MHWMVPDMYSQLRKFTEGDGSWIVAVVFSAAVEIEKLGGRGYIHQKSCARL